MWNDLIGKASDAVPQFNKRLLLGFREDKIKQIPEYLDDLFNQAITTLDNHLDRTNVPERDRLRYVGYSELTPEELIDFLRQSKGSYKTRFDVEPTNSKTVRFEFRFQEEAFFMYVNTPIIVNYAVTLSGVDYFPQFAIVEKGGMRRKKDEVVLQVMRANLKFYRDTKGAFRTTDGRAFKEVVVTTRIHMKSRKRPPVVIYHLAKYGFGKTMAMYDMSDHLQIVDNCQEQKGYTYVQIKSDAYIKVSEEGLLDINVIRMIVSLLCIYRFCPKFDLLQILGAPYYAVALGRWTCPASVVKRTLLHDNAMYHLRMNDSILDPAAISQHKGIGIDANNIDELLLQAFFNIDAWLSSTTYQQIDLYQKKIGTLDQMMAGLVRTFNGRLFKKVVNDKAGLTRDGVKSLMYATRRNQWITGSTIFASMPTVYNDNYLLSIGAKRYRSRDNAEMAGDGGRKQSMSVAEGKAHPSQLVVESILYYPSSSPVTTGSINPYLQIDEDGNIIRPPWADEIEHVFD